MESIISLNPVSSRQLLLISRPWRHSLPSHLSTRRNLLIHAARSSPPVPLHLPMTPLSFSSIHSLQPHKSPTNIGVSFLKRARKTLTVAIIVAAFSLLPFPPSGFHPAIAAPAVAEKTEKSETLADHEFSCYTRRLLSVVSVLLRKIEDAELGRGDMAGVKDALKEVKASNKKIQDDVIGNLNAELKELRRVNMELTKRSEEVLGKAKVAMKERDRLLGSDEKGQDKTVRLEDLDRAIGDAEKEYNDLWKEIGETENKIMRRETVTYSIAVRELSFIEEECELLVQRFGHRMMEDAHASQQIPSIEVSGKDIQNALEKAQKEYWEQMVLPKVLGTDDPEMLLDSSINDFSQKIERVLGESQQIQRNLEDQIRQKFKQFGDEKRFIVKTPETEVLKGFPEAELKWMFGTKEVVVPNAVRVHLLHGWKKWREDTKAKLKKQLLEDLDQGKQYVAQRRELIILDRERLITKTWYNDERKRWEMDPVAVPYAVSKKLIEYARIRHDWAVMYVKLKGDNKEYFVDIMVFDMLFEKFGGFDGLYTSMIASGIPTTVQLMWIPFSDLDIGEQVLLTLRLSSLCFTGIWNSAGISYVKKAVFSIIKDITDDLMITTFFPIIEFIIPESVRRKIGMAWPEEASQTVESTWFLKWQSDAELNYRARKRDNISWYLWFFIRSSLYVYVLFGAILYFKRNVLCYLGFGPLRRHDPNLRKLEILNYYFRYKKKRGDQMREDGVDPIRSAFDQMKRIKNPPIRLVDFASIESMRDEINDIVTCLQNPTAFREKGARAPRGILIVGETGTGKTSLALAIAAEARVPVVEVKAQQLEAGLWVGQSASNVRELFQAARDLVPVIIFIEDFDLFAGVRGKYIHTEKQDHEAFINQLLVELDGFENQDGVVLIATTRKLNQVDEALRRPGRMDRVLHLQRPTQMEREKILLLAAKETMDNDLMNFVDWKKVAEKTALLKPCDLKLVPSALEASAYRNKFLDPDELMDYSSLLVILRKVIPAWLWETKLLKKISMNLGDHLGLTLTKEDIQSVVDLMEPYGQISNGLELLSPPINWTTQEKFPHAVWAAGRGLIALLLPNYDVVDHIWLEPASWEGIGCTKITKVRREGSLNGNLESRSYLEKKLVFCFGSFVAAQLLLPFGEENILSSSEIKKAQEIATRMVLQYGWGPDDSPAIYVTDNAFGVFSMGNKHALEMAAKVEELFKLAYEKARAMLQKNCRVLEAYVEQLLEFEILKGEDLIRVFEENGGIREEEPFTIIKHEKTEADSERSLEGIEGIGDSAAAVAFLGAS